MGRVASLFNCSRSALWTCSFLWSQLDSWLHKNSFVQLVSGKGLVW